MTTQGECVGVVEHIFTAAAAGGAMRTHSNIQAIAGEGLAGDRYAIGKGYYSQTRGVVREVTLVEIEALEMIKREEGIDLRPEESRRNLATRGVSLESLLYAQFQVGDVQLFGARMSTPCKYLEQLTGKPVFQALIGRAGLNCRILTSGTIHVGDPVVLEAMRNSSP